MEDLRDKLLERAGKPNVSAGDAKDFVTAALQIESHIREAERTAKYDELEGIRATGLRELTQRVEALEKKGKGAKKKSG